MPIHRCKLDSAESMWGPAIDQCVEREDGTLWAGNGEYESQVNFCPACGYAAKVKTDAFTSVQT